MMARYHDDGELTPVVMLRPLVSTRVAYNVSTLEDKSGRTISGDDVTGLLLLKYTLL